MLAFSSSSSEEDGSAPHVFTTRDNKQSTTSDDYFLSSAHKVSCFLEEDAVDAEGNILVPQIDLAINKIGHAMHDVDSVFREFSRSDKIKQVCRTVGVKNATPVQSMYICKQPRIGGEVKVHQDSTFLATEPTPTCVGLWLALEEAHEKNGCLWVLPKSHNTEIARRFRRRASRGGSGLGEKENDPTGTGPVYFDAPLPDYTLDDFIPVPVQAGDMVLLNGALVHMSYPNTSSSSRHAYSLHVVDGSQTWSADNWLQRPPTTPFEPFEPLE